MNERGATAVEYAMLIVGIAAALVLGVSLFGERVRELFRAAAEIFNTLK